MAAGELGIDIYNMRPALAAAGFHYVETLDDLGELTVLIAATAISANRRQPAFALAVFCGTMIAAASSHIVI